MAEKEKIYGGAQEITLLPSPAFIAPVHWGRLPCLGAPCLQSESEGAAGERNPVLRVWWLDRNQKCVCVFVKLLLLNNYGCLNTTPLGRCFESAGFLCSALPGWLLAVFLQGCVEVVADFSCQAWFNSLK